MRPAVPQSESFKQGWPMGDVDEPVPVPPVLVPTPAVPAVFVAPPPVEVLPPTEVVAPPPSSTIPPVGLLPSDPQAGISPTIAADRSPTEVRIDSRVFTLKTSSLRRAQVASATRLE
jgi:hypothetical protein